MRTTSRRPLGPGLGPAAIGRAAGLVAPLAASLWGEKRCQINNVHMYFAIWNSYYERYPGSGRRLIFIAPQCCHLNLSSSIFAAASPCHYSLAFQAQLLASIANCVAALICLMLASLTISGKSPFSVLNYFRLLKSPF